MPLANLLENLHRRLQPFSRPVFYAAALTVLVAVALAVRYQVTRPPGHGNLPEFDQPDTSAMKSAFFDFLRPVARHHNNRIAEERAWLMQITGKDALDWFEKRRLERLARRYRIDPDERSQDEMLAMLKRRVDIVPESLVLIQAAKESGWGRSRFAREGNTLFGEWCFEEGCGIVPDARLDGASHEIRNFPTVHAAVGSYLRNLNTHPGYAKFRQARQELRAKDENLSGIALAEHLERYSERGDAYVEEIVSMIIQNDLEAD